MRRTALDFLIALAIGSASVLLTIPDLRARGFTLVWTGAVALGVLARVPTRRWVPYVVVFAVATIFAFVRIGYTAPLSVARGLSDVAIYAGGALALRRVLPKPPANTGDAWVLVLLGAVIGVLRGGVAYLSWMVQKPSAIVGVLLPGIGTACASFVGVLVWMPFVLLIANRNYWAGSSRRTRRFGTMWLGGTIALTALIFFAPIDPLYRGTAFLLVPVVVILAAMYTQVVMAVALVIIAVVSTYATSHGFGPFVAGGVSDMHAAAFSVQTFLVSLAVSSWMLAGAVAANRAAKRDIEERLRESTELADQLRVAVMREQAAQGELQRLVDEDQVTGLHSRSWVTARVGELLESNLRTGERTGVLFLELAPYLVVYRAHGYAVGDDVLRRLGARMLPLLPEGALLGRFEGMTLIIVLPVVHRREEMEQLATDLLLNVAQELEVAGRRLSRTGNIGGAVSRASSTVVSLLQEADRSLSRAELGGRSRWHVSGWDDEREDPLELVELEHDLRNALDAGQFVVHFQPQVRLADGGVCGYEALVRWQHPQRGLVSPSLFMDAMETSGLALRLGRQVLGIVCDELRAHPALPGPVSVNVTAVELDDDGWLPGFIDIVRANAVEPSRIVVELTETAVVDLSLAARESLHRLRDFGVRVHLDDFGTGYTSVNTLISLPIDAVKLDRSLCTPLSAGNPADLALVRAIAALAASLGLETIAEGIEDEQQALALHKAGWNVGQGFHFGAPSPLPASTLASTAWL